MRRQVVINTTLGLLLLVTGVVSAQTSTPQVLKVQGFLSDGVSGTPVPASGPFSMTFRLFDNELAGQLLATVGPLTVDVAEGIYVVELPFGAEVFDGSERFLDIEVEGESLAPRLRVVSTPFAYMAETVGGSTADELEESAEIDAKLTDHDNAAGVHAAEIGAALTVHSSDGGAHAAEINAVVAVHASDNGAHAAEIEAAMTVHESVADAHPSYVWRGGDSMTGPLAINVPVSVALLLSAPDDVDVAFSSGGGPSHTLGWDETDQAFAFSDALALDNGKLLHWPMNSGPSAGVATYSFSKLATSPPGQNEHPDGELDETFQFCYNCRKDGSTFQADPGQHAWNQKFEANYWNSGGKHEQLEVNWNFTDPSGFKWRPFAYVMQVSGNCTGGFQAGQPCITAQEIAACESGGGRCEGDNTGKWDWEASPFGFCGVDHSIVCKTTDDCPSGNCYKASDLALEQGRGRLISRQGMLIDAYQPGTASASSYSALQVEQDVEPDDAIGPFYGMQLVSTFTSGAQPDSGVGSWFGVRASQIFNGSTPQGRFVSDRMVGVEVRQELSQTALAGQGGAGVTVPTLSGVSWQLQPTGSNLSVGTAAGLRLESPDALSGGGSAVSFAEFDGIRIDDLKGYGTTNHAVHVASQGGGDGNSGNIHMAGGGATDGHLNLGDGHLWFDDTTSVFRWKDGSGNAAPVSATDGAPLHSPQGMSDDWGDALWGNGDGALDNGSKVCAQAGLDCAGAFDLNTDQNRTCGYSNWSGPVFLAFCK